MLITHDLGVVAGIADRVMVMYAGRQVELGTVDEIFYRPRHPYTRGCSRRCRASTAASRDERLHRIEGQPPSLIFLPPGCAFHPRCPYADLQGLCVDRRFRRCVDLERWPLLRVSLRDDARRTDAVHAVTATNASAVRESCSRSRDLVKEFPIRAGLLLAHGRRRCKAVSGVSFSVRAGPDARLGRRVGLRQDARPAG